MMAIYGTCEECGRETKDYVCIGCTWERLERLEAENVSLRAVADAAEPWLHTVAISMDQQKLQAALLRLREWREKTNG